MKRVLAIAAVAAAFAGGPAAHAACAGPARACQVGGPPKVHICEPGWGGDGIAAGHRARPGCCVVIEDGGSSPIVDTCNLDGSAEGVAAAAA